MILFSVFPHFVSFVLFTSLVYLYQVDFYQKICEYLIEQYAENAPVFDTDAGFETANLRCRILQPCNNIDLSLLLNELVNTTGAITNTQHCSSAFLHQNENYIPELEHESLIRYSRKQLLELKPSNKGRVSNQTFETIKSLGIQHRGRGRRGGAHIKKKIPVLYSNGTRYEQNANSSTVDFRPQILIPVPTVRNQPQHNHANVSQSTQLSRVELPNIFLSNTQSLMNKFDEAKIVFEQQSVDVGVITESWFKSSFEEHQLNISGYELFTKSRDNMRGGGVAVYVRDSLPATAIDYIEVPNDLECVWVKIRPNRLPRGISAIAVCAVYITTDSPYQNLLEEHLIQSIDLLRTKYPEIGIVILGDFNRMDIYPVTRGNDLSQLIDFPTRGDATLDLILTNHALKSRYNKPIPMSPLGFSDHICVLWKSQFQVKTKNTFKINKSRPLQKSGISAFGQWVQDQDWHEVLESCDTQTKADVFYSMLDIAIDSCFPVKKTKMHNNDKPWLTPHIKKLIHERQVAFANKDQQQWRKLRNLVKREIEKAKLHYHATRIRNLQTTEPRKWHQQIRTVTNSSKRDLKINIQGIEDKDLKGIANAINSKFAHVSDCLDPLDCSRLPSYLPAEEPVPQLYPWEVYAELRKLKSAKSCGPDQVSPKLAKEFAYELSVPLTEILNNSYSEGYVPEQWKKAIVIPIPKQYPPSIDKLRTVSLTSIFAKIAEGFITDWVLNDIQNDIDIRQYGNVKGVSTSHYLVSLVHFLFQGAERSRNIGTVVLTDFSKAFDLVDHTLLIGKIIDMGVRRSIVPWICDFLRNRQQCVKYNSVLSDYTTLQGGVPQGTKFGPIGFQILINEAAQDAGSQCWKYVDDLTFAENFSGGCASSLQDDLDQFSEWASDSHLKLNPSKCQAMQIAFSNPLPPHRDLRIGTEPLSYVTEAKVLGLWLQNNLKWNVQMDAMLKKANSRLFMLRTLKRFGFSTQELGVVYSGYVRPILEYADVVWHSGISAKQSKELEAIQKRACRTILGRHYLSYSDALQICKFDTLSDRREEHCLRFAEGLTKSIRTSSLIPPTRKECHGRSLRNSSNLSQFRTRTNRFRNSPLPFFVDLLNK